MNGIEKFQRLGIKDLAARLGLHPFDVVRILVAKGMLPPNLTFDEADVERIRQSGGIEHWWRGDHQVEEDSIRARGVLRSIARELIQRRIHDENTTRVDNLYRGLSPEDEHIARRAVNLLIQERFLRTVSTPLGNHVTIQHEQVQAMQRLAAGTDVPAGLASLWLGASH